MRTILKANVRMIDCKELSKQFRELGINNFQAWNAVIPLDEVFGLDPKKHNGGLNPYGVSDFSLFERGISITYYNGDIFTQYQVCTNGRELTNKKSRYATKAEEQGIYNYCMKLINERKSKIEKEVYWSEHFNEFCEKCLNFAREYFKVEKPNYSVKLLVGNTQANKRVTPSLVLYDGGGHQYAYISIILNRVGDITFDACNMCHSKYDVDPDNFEHTLKSACHWIS